MNTVANERPEPQIARQARAAADLYQKASCYLDLTSLEPTEAMSDDVPMGQQDVGEGEQPYDNAMILMES